MMRWSMPIFALALAIALGAMGPVPATQRHHLGNASETMMPSLAAFSLFSSAEATTLADTRGYTVCTTPPVALQDNALLWAASLRGWSEGPTVRAWRRFVAWTKQSWRPAAPCAATQASLG